MNETKEGKDGIWKHCNNSAVRRASRQLGQLYDDLLEGTGLRSTQFALLSQIAVSGQPSQKALAEAMVMDLSALGHTLKPLARDGLVEFIADSQDRRIRRVALTAAGVAKQKELMARWEDAQRRFAQVFGEKRSADIRDALAFISSAEFARAFRGADEKRA